MTIGNKTLVPAKSADWLLNLCNLSPILMALKPKHLKRLMATCRQLRAVVYDLHKLGTGNWLNLQTLVLQQTLDAPEVCYLTEGQLPQLTSLQLRLTDCLYASGLLAVGKWPLLQKLNLSHSRLSVIAMGGIKHGKWPGMRELLLHNCRLDYQAISHLTDASWHQLQLMDLRGNDLDGRDLANLSVGRWPSLATLHAGNILEPVAWNHLLAGQWPQLEKLTLTAKWPSVPAATGFPRPDPYSVGPSRFSALKHLHIYQPQFCQSLAASLVSSWQATLCSLDLKGCDITGAALQPFGQAHWPNLTTLILSCTDVDAEGIGHIVRGKMPMLQLLNLSLCQGMDAAAFRQLSASRWPELKTLTFGCAMLHPRPTAMSAAAVDEARINCVKPLTQAKWPKLEQLELRACTITVKALKVLVKGDWPELQRLDLSHHQLTWFAFGALRGKSKQPIRLSLNQLRPTRLLAGGLWPKLRWLNLTPA